MSAMKRIERVLRAIHVAIALTKVVVGLVAAFAGFAVVAAALTAYLKREQWTKPACRWVRDASGRWNMTPWTPRDTDAS